MWKQLTCGLSLLLFGCLLFMKSVKCQEHHGFTPQPIELRTLYVNTNVTGCTNVTVGFESHEIVNVLWTTDAGFAIKDLIKDKVTAEDQSMSVKTASVCVPREKKYEEIFLHLYCDKHSYELHLNLKLSNILAESNEQLKQPLLLIPSSHEIGISSRGEAMFHVMVNTSGTDFTFGMLQTEVTILNGGLHENDVAYSFYPGEKHKVVNMKKISGSIGEYHTDITIKSKNLKSSDTIIAVSTASTNPTSILQRLDIKQTINLQPQIYSSDRRSVAFIKEEMSEHLKTTKHADVLLRCKAIGLPVPTINLYKDINGKLEPALVPYYTTTNYGQRTTSFQLFNVSDPGKYVCKGTNGETSAEKIISIQVNNLVS